MAKSETNHNNKLDDINKLNHKISSMPYQKEYKLPRDKRKIADVIGILRENFPYGWACDFDSKVTHIRELTSMLSWIFLRWKWSFKVKLKVIIKNMVNEL